MKKKKNHFFKKDKKFNRIKIGEKISFKKLITSSSIQNMLIFELVTKHLSRKMFNETIV